MNALQISLQELFAILKQMQQREEVLVNQHPPDRLPPRVQATREALLVNRFEIVKLTLMAHEMLGRFFSHTRAHALALFRLALAQALVCAAASVPDPRHPALQEDLHELDIILRVTRAVRRYPSGINQIGPAAETFGEIIAALEKGVSKARRLAREFGRLSCQRLSRHSRTALSPLSEALLAQVREGNPFLAIPSLLDSIPPRGGWQIKGKTSWRGQPCAEKDLPAWGQRYLRWLNRALETNPAGDASDWIRVEARALYRVIRWAPRRERDARTAASKISSLGEMVLMFNNPDQSKGKSLLIHSNAKKPSFTFHLAPGESKVLHIPVHEADWAPQAFGIFGPDLNQTDQKVETFANPNPPPREPLLCPPDERAYYQGIHGFDPETGWDAKDSRYLYEAWFPLVADPQLSAVGVTIGARVGQVPGKQPHNHIIFRGQDGREAGIYCTHTVLYAGPAGDALRFADDTILQNASVQAERDFLAKTGGPVQLPPWGHFAALKSYVAGIAEVGILAMLGTAAGEERTGSIPITFGFNAAMQRQVLGALRSIAPEATDAIVRDYFLRLLDDAPLDWVISRLGELDRKFALASILFSQPEFLKEVLSRIPAITISNLLLPSPSFITVTRDSSSYAQGFQVLLAALPPPDRQRAADFIKKLTTGNVLDSIFVAALSKVKKPGTVTAKTTAFIDTGADIPVISPAGTVKLRKKTRKRARWGSKGTV